MRLYLFLFHFDSRRQAADHFMSALGILIVHSM